ncbi:Asp-tRNA(Asn)/Glu-tRNA(Gln) amidotransferase subunit GatB [Candidatus Collierbacteria bacterium]|nr:Asp-tRNA(Asn)/Glu-tRNA(Gln) amidotransferase subunit GatB [Candidatus Collierbacteria bacterium]
MTGSFNYIPIIGLEIHVELKSNSKMFCGCRNDPFGASKPNIYTCPVCLGLPGALPVPNKKAIESTVKLGLGLGCEINRESRFDRKHYFYPDLPKGYQISQYERPFATNGRLQVTGYRLEKKTVRIRRVHLEEDTGKLLHRKINGEEVSLIDFNRSGVPLVEIVTEPDIRSAEEAKETAKKIHRIVRSLEVSDADMEKGSMRLEANISMFKGLAFEYKGQALPNYKVEIKNINSFRFLERAIEEEIERQRKILESGKEVKQETRGWDTQSMTSKSQRTKEEAADYRYFPEPDIPPISLSDDWISKIKTQISKLPEEIYEELIRAGVAEQAARIISANKDLAAKVQESTIKYNKVQKDEELEAKEIGNFGNWVLHHQLEVREKPAEELIYLFKQGKEGIVSDSEQLEGWVLGVIEDNPRAVADFKAGKQQAIGFLIGQVQRLAGGKADVKKVKEILLEKITNK